ncbi:chorismate lyase [Enterobacteriaceae bacterium LUAb1]
MSDQLLAQLHALEWLPSDSSMLTPSLRSWLMEEDSMTQRFETYCNAVTVTLLHEEFVAVDDVSAEALHLPKASRYWLREILLCGDGEPWLVGRTVVPESTLNGPERVLKHLGTQPLGRYLFASSRLTRDFIEPGQYKTLWGRRSRLCLSGKPLLLTELFLPASPLYRIKDI